ncbi:MAG: hypothetical protein AUH96_02985, partial [Nitrospirae bacterium 13_2_20CM_2_61_4]
MLKPKKPLESSILRRITVRLVPAQDCQSPERERFDRLLEEKHYLQSARLGGQSLRYVAELDGQWVALITFSAAALNIKAREKKIGWTPRQRARRLGFVVNNSRFLVLSDRQRYPNLASRVLALCLKRLSSDWSLCWGHPVVLVESFVDESHYRGTCYRACNFEAVGLTGGYGRSSRDFYEEHGQPKQLYLRELRKGAASILRRARLPDWLIEHEERIGMAMLMGAGSYKGFEDVCGRFTQRQLRALGCRINPKTDRYAAPSDTTFFRNLNGVDASKFDLLVGQWMMEQEISVVECLAVDGKTLRGSGRSDGKALQLLSAVSHRLRLSLAQEPIEEKSNEIPAIKPLLKKIPRSLIAGSLITADALHCQQES